MALVLEDGQNVWRKVDHHFSGQGTTNHPALQEQFRALKKYLVEQKGNPQLAFVPYSAELIVTAGGYAAADAACKVYGIYVKGRRTTGTTFAFVQLFAQADNTASTSLIFHLTRLGVTGQKAGEIWPDGVAVETALTIASDTTVAGATESAAADAADGFVIYGAA